MYESLKPLEISLYVLSKNVDINTSIKEEIWIKINVQNGEINFSQRAVAKIPISNAERKGFLNIFFH